MAASVNLLRVLTADEILAVSEAAEEVLAGDLDALGAPPYTTDDDRSRARRVELLQSALVKLRAQPG